LVSNHILLANSNLCLPKLWLFMKCTDWLLFKRVTLIIPLLCLNQESFSIPYTKVSNQHIKLYHSRPSFLSSSCPFSMYPCVIFCTNHDTCDFRVLLRYLEGFLMLRGIIFKLKKWATSRRLSGTRQQARKNVGTMCTFWFARQHEVICKADYWVSLYISFHITKMGLWKALYSCYEVKMA
jgi:hypothetical protein